MEGELLNCSESHQGQQRLCPYRSTKCGQRIGQDDALDGAGKVASKSVTQDYYSRPVLDSLKGQPDTAQSHLRGKLHLIGLWACLWGLF